MKLSKNLQEAFGALGVKFNAAKSWQDLIVEIDRIKEKSETQQEAFYTLDHVYNFPANADTSRVIQATQPEMRKLFLESRDKPYLIQLASAVPLFGASDVWAFITTKEIVIPGSMKSMTKTVTDTYHTVANSETVSKASEWGSAVKGAIPGWGTTVRSVVVGKAYEMVTGISGLFKSPEEQMAAEPSTPNTPSTPSTPSSPARIAQKLEAEGVTGSPKMPAAEEKKAEAQHEPETLEEATKQTSPAASTTISEPVSPAVSL